ncbi:MAG: glycosyl transferase family 1 [Ferruginibacter sp.]|nr:glycosyl transferase family 1 [Ferruginibacter sp.]
MEEWTRDTPLKVLMTTDTIGGVWSYAIELCRSLKEFNVHFHVVTTGAPMQFSQKEEIKALENVTVYETDFLLEWMDSPWQSIDNSGAWLLELAAEVQPNLVHLNSYSYGSLNWNAPVIMVAHSDVFSWWLAVKQGYPPVHWNKYFKKVHRGLQKANLIIAPSKSSLKDIRKIYFGTAPGRVIYNGRDGGLFYPAEKQPVVCSMGRIWDEAKNIRLLVEAAKKIRCPIRLAGDTSFGNDYCSTAGANITNLGKIAVTQIAAELSVASIYVLPAKYEPFGLSVLEAALSGCALVLGNIPSLKEIWGDSALYINTNDAAGLADTVNHLLESDELRQHYAAMAIERAKRYSTEAMAGNYINVYHELLNTGEPVTST